MPQIDTTTEGRGAWAGVNGLHMYYEIHGAGEPLVLLHGGYTTIETSFDAVLPALAQTRRIIAIEQQGHGRTADIDRPMTFEQMADDTAALLRSIGVDNADIFGFSDGGNVGLGLAIRHPGLVRKLVVAGTNFNRDGLYPEILEFLASGTAEDLGELGDAYAAVAPEPDAWPTVVAKVNTMSLEFAGWDRDDLRAISAPTLVMIGDNDIVRTEHAVELVRLIPDTQFAVLPGTDHIAFMTRSEWLLSMIPEFLDAEAPAPE